MSNNGSQQVDLTLINSGISLSNILCTNEGKARKTKIICTIGPAVWSPEKLLELIDAGMNVARLNFSHGEIPMHVDTLKKLRAAAAQRPNKNVAILLDTKGPEIRTGLLENGKSIELTKGQKITISTDYNLKGNDKIISCSYKALPTSVKVGQKILVADGSLTMFVLKTDPENGTIEVELANAGTLSERKNMNLPGVVVDLPTITEKDKIDLKEFAVKYQVDFVAASFVRKGSDIKVIRQVLGERGKMIKIIAKIENQEGLANFDDILRETDGIMVARGDLGMELAPEKVFLAQKMMIRRCNVAGKYVITATQMLESMISNPRPFRSECTDIANAVLDGSDCVMLSGETAVGKFPIEAVGTMSAVCIEAEGAINYEKLHTATRNSVMIHNHHSALSTPEAVASSAVKTCIDLNAKMLVVLTESGNTARLVAKYRPKVPILVLTALENIARQTEGVLRGTSCIIVGSMVGTDSLLLRAAEIGKQNGWIKSGDCLIAVHGQKEQVSGSSNMIKVLIVE